MGSNRSDVKSQEAENRKDDNYVFDCTKTTSSENFHTPVLSVRDHPRKQSLSHQVIH